MSSANTETFPPQPVTHPHKWRAATIVLLVLIIFQSLTCVYLFFRNNMLQKEYSIMQSSYNQLRHKINERSQHVNASCFVTPWDDDVKNMVTKTTGGWSDKSDWTEFWNDVMLMYEWTVKNITYRQDSLFPLLPQSPLGNIQYVREMWQFPNETLDMKNGDCEDLAILLCSMIRCYTQGKYFAECILITGSKGAHIAVQVQVEPNKLTILDPAGHYYTKTRQGDVASKDLSAEINNWLNYWKPSLGNDVRVEGVFADYLNKTFSSTDEYISWMHSRSLISEANP